MTTAQIENILDQFDVKISNYEVVNIDEKKGWSAKFLFLIIEKNVQYILKGKSKEQLAGYLDDIEISNFLSSLGFSVRTAIKTPSSDYHYIQDDIYWDLKTYVPGSVMQFSDYIDESIISLAKVNTTYIKVSLNNASLKGLNLKTKDFSNSTDALNSLEMYKEVLRSIIGGSTENFAYWLRFAQNEVKTILAHNPDFSIIHNDLNHKNILLDLDTMKVVSFIDWDHGCISTPLKDILEPINMFYDFVPQKYEHVRKIYLDTIRTDYDLKITDSELSFMQVYFYTLSKWNYITTFAKLISELGNSTNELTAFENVVVTQLAKLKEIGKHYNLY